MKVFKQILSFLFLMNTCILFAQEGAITVIPQAYDRALRNPMMGFTTINVGSHPWNSLSHTYIRWNEIENHESDGIEKIISVCNQKWSGAAAKNMKIIPRLYLHWDGDQKYWPADLQKDDYTSEEFRKRVLRLIERLGICWDNDPRVAFIEMGIIGKWGEHHSPSPTLEMQKLIGDAFAKAFKNKKVSVRHFWDQFTNNPFGEYWDSWAHYDQMYPHGNSIKQLNKNGRYKVNYIGGEVAYNWGNWELQPGTTPTRSVAIQQHRDFVINTIRWLHCTQLRWIDSYDRYNADAVAGAEEMQKAFGYRYVLNQVQFSLSDSLWVSFDVTNTGSAPFYYKWPVEVALLNPVTLKPVWSSTFKNTDIRNWLPGDGWTDPEWIPSGNWSQYYPNTNWNNSKAIEWAIPPVVNKLEDQFKIDVPEGNYILSLAILDPAGNLPSIKFATSNYINGGRHPMGLISVGDNKCYPLPVDFQFNDLYQDSSLYYDDKFVINDVPDPVQTPYGGKPWQFPVDTVSAWQYDFMNYKEGVKFFSLDTAKTIGIYACEDTSGQNIRAYQDSSVNPSAAQFKWDPSSETFKRNGQWLEYTSEFKINQAYQLLLKARTGKNANFKFRIYTNLGDTVFMKDANTDNDFEYIGDGIESVNWMLSKFAIPALHGIFRIRFDWYDNIGEPGIFGEFSFVGSTLDVAPPSWYFISIGTFPIGTDIEVATTETCKVYMVPEGTEKLAETIFAASLTEIDVNSYTISYINTTDLNAGNYILYALDGSENISVASQIITLEGDSNNAVKQFSHYKKDIYITYNAVQESITVFSSNDLCKVFIYDILGNLKLAEDINGIEYSYKLNSFINGPYFLRAMDSKGNSKTIKFIKL